MKPQILHWQFPVGEESVLWDQAERWAFPRTLSPVLRVPKESTSNQVRV